MHMVDLIRKKRDGGILTAEEIAFMIRGYVSGSIPDHQMSAWLMAVYFRGLNADETACLTRCMMQSGETLDLSRFGELSVDKHSTGGVGDKTTLIVAPIVAALGMKMAKMSGRGLGHTGGTVDKLGAIPGFRTELTPQEMIAQVEKIGVAVIGQTDQLTPADRMLYALRDVTATVDSLPLIASSVMSKKLAAGAHNIVLDVKTGSGAFMRRREDAKRLAQTMTDIGTACGRRVSALVTDMDVPLGRAVGNALEVEEAVRVLRGEGPQDLYEVCVELSARLAEMALGWTPGEAEARVRGVLADGSAYARFLQWIATQGGDPGSVTRPGGLPRAELAVAVSADAGGTVRKMNAETVGRVSMCLGGGRERKEDEIDPGAGLILHKKPGERVAAGEPLATLYTSRPERVDEARALFLSACEIENN